MVVGEQPKHEKKNPESPVFHDFPMIFFIDRSFPPAVLYPITIGRLLLPPASGLLAKKHKPPPIFLPIWPKKEKKEEKEEEEKKRKKKRENSLSLVSLSFSI